MPAFRALAGPGFEADAKKLAKKIRALHSDLAIFLHDRLLENPRLCGDRIPRSNYWWKGRVPLPGERRGAQGGLRIIYGIEPNAKVVVLLMLYDKRSKANVTSREIKRAAEHTRPLLRQHLLSQGRDPNEIAF